MITKKFGLHKRIFVFSQLDAFYRSSSLSQWYNQVEIDSFTQGSVLVWYFLSLTSIEADIDTKDLRERLNDDLDRSAHSIGNFTVDPEGTEFIGKFLFKAFNYEVNQFQINLFTLKFGKFTLNINIGIYILI